MNPITSLRKKVKSSLFNLLLPSGFYFKQEGFCPCCSQNVTFFSNHHYLRDNFKCSNCHCIPRERALMFVLENNYPNWKNLKIHESSPGSRGASAKIKKDCLNYAASQFFPEEKLGINIRSFRNEDLEDQTFEDETFDIVITQDVMEHVYHPEKAFAEIARTLKKGGAHIFTVPIINRHNKTEIWAKLDSNGNTVFLDEPEYHGNPITSQGSPVTMHWGFDIVDFIKESSGLETQIVHLDYLQLGIRADFIEVLISKKI